MAECDPREFVEICVGNMRAIAQSFLVSLERSLSDRYRPTGDQRRFSIAKGISTGFLAIVV